MAKTRRLKQKALNKHAGSIEKITIKTLDYGFTVRVGCKTIAVDSFQELMDSLAFYLLKPKEAQNELYYGSNRTKAGIMPSLQEFHDKILRASATPSGLFPRPRPSIIDDRTPTTTCHGCEKEVENVSGVYVTTDGAKPMCAECFEKLKESETQYMKGES